LFILLVQIFKQQFASSIVKRKAEQPILFKYILYKKSVDCSERSKNHYVSLKITRSGGKPLGVAPIQYAYFLT